MRKLLFDVSVVLILPAALCAGAAISASHAPSPPAASRIAFAFAAIALLPFAVVGALIQALAPPPKWNPGA